VSKFAGLRIALLAGTLLFAPGNLESQNTCSNITVLANVLDRRGIPVKGLPKGVFKATYKGTPLNIVDATYSEKARRIAILLDISGSMRGPEKLRSPVEGDKWRVALAVVAGVVTTAAAGTNFSMMTFADKIYDRLLPSSDNTEILRWIDSNARRKPNELHGRTALHAAILQAAKQMEPAQAGDAIYVVTDGGENASNISPAHVYRALQASGTRLFTILLKEPHHFLEEYEHSGEVSEITLHSGGYQISIAPKTGNLQSTLNPQLTPPPPLYRFDDAMLTEIKAAAAMLDRQTEGFYLLTLESKPLIRKPTEWKLEVTQLQDSRESVLTYPRELLPCSMP